VRKASRVIQTVRDAIVALLSIVLISTDIGPGKEMANYMLAGICGVLLALTIVNVSLNAFRVKRKGYFYGNAIFQLILGFFFLLLFAPLGVILLLFNLAVVASLWEKKTPEELLKHPPKPVTVRHRVLIGAGVLVMLSSFFFSWLSSVNFPLIGFYLGTVDLSLVSDAVSSSTVTTIFGLLALAGAPISLIIGALGLVRRRFAWISGSLALIIGVGWILLLTANVGLGLYVFVFGAIVVLSALFIPNKVKSTES
jgi:MFS family permease